MKKIIIGSVSFLIVLVIMAFLFAIRMRQAKDADLEEMSDLPSTMFFDKDGSEISLDAYKESTLLLFFFNTTCDMCQFKAEKVAKSVEELLPYQVFFISAESKEKIAEFFENFNLKGHPNINWLEDRNANMGADFQISYVPITLHYKEGRLQRRFDADAPWQYILDNISP